MRRSKSFFAIYGILLIILQVCSFYFAVINASAQDAVDISKIYEEHPVQDVDFWKDYYKKNPEIEDRFKFKGGYARYMYDRSAGHMVKWGGTAEHSGMDEPIEYSVYAEDGTLIQSANVRPVIPEPPSIYFDAIPMKYVNKFWVRSGDEESGRRTEARHQTDNDPSAYISGNHFKDSTEQDDSIWANNQYSATVGPHFGEKYQSVAWSIGYFYDIRIVSKDYWPVENVEKTFYVPYRDDEDLKNVLYNFQDNYIDDEYLNPKAPNEVTGRGTLSHYETVLSGKRTFVNERFSENEYIDYDNKYLHPDTDPDPKKNNSYYSHCDITNKDNGCTKEYYVIEDLAGLPGYYYCIYIKVEDSYNEEAVSEGVIDAGASSTVSEYKRLKPIVTEKLVSELAALTPVASFSTNEGAIVQEETTEAKEEAGEDNGTDIKDEVFRTKDISDGVNPGTIAIGIAGAVVAGAGAAAAGGAKSKKSKDSEKTEPKPSHYKMYINKDFGDAIRKGAEPVIVRARIMEIAEDGTKKPRLDLTHNISVSGEGLQIGSASITGSWMDAEVYADEQSTANNGSVVFDFAGEGGIFRKRVVFRLVGQPYIVFPDSDVTSTDMCLRMIANDPEVYSARFFFEDAVDEPNKITFSAGERFKIEHRMAENARTYYADVTAKPQLENPDIFVAPEREYIGIHAEFKNGDTVDGLFYVEIWPEGLSVTSRHVNNDRLEIDTVANPEAGDLDYKIRPTDFEVRFAYRDKSSGTPVFLKGAQLEPSFSDLYEVDKYGNTFKGNFRFTIDTQFDLYSFDPQDTLPMLKGPYEVMIDMECEAGGETYTMPLPLSFYGEKPLLPSNAKWQEVYRKLKRDIQVFGLGADPDIRTMIRKARTMSAADLEYVRYWIILCGTHYYENESREYAKIDKVMTNYIVVASALVKIGDKAVEAAIKLKWPNADASVIAAFINPWKNALAEFLGQYVAKLSIIDISEGDPEDFEFIKTMLDSCESGLQEIITSEEAVVDPKTGGKIVSLYMMVCFAKHYFYGEGKEKGDIFKSVIETFKDLTMAKLKAYFTELLKGAGEYLGKVANYLGKHFSKIMKYVGYEKGLELAKLAYDHQVRMALQNSGELSNAAYKAAKGFGEAVKNQYMDGVGKQLVEAGLGAAEWTAEYGLAAIINYISKGTKDENEAYGVTTPEVLVELGVDRGEDLLKLLAAKIKEKKHIDIMKYYIDAKKTVNDAMDVSARLDGELLIMSFYGYTIEINIVENADAIFGLFYEICFGWMEDLWKSMQSCDPNWDPRNDLSDDTTMVDRMTERVKSLGSSANITYKD